MRWEAPARGMSRGGAERVTGRIWRAVSWQRSDAFRGRPSVVGATPRSAQVFVVASCGTLAMAALVLRQPPPPPSQAEPKTARDARRRRPQRRQCARSTSELGPAAVLGSLIAHLAPSPHERRVTSSSVPGDELSHVNNRQRHRNAEFMWSGLDPHSNVDQVKLNTRIHVMIRVKLVN